MLRYGFSDDAVADLDAIAAYLAARNPDASTRVLASIVAAIERACLFPDAAPEVDQPGEVLGARTFVEATYRYVIYYRVIDRALLVLRVFHDVYAVGDVTSVGTPKAGVFSEGAARVVAASLIADLQSCFTLRPRRQ